LHALESCSNASLA